MFARSFPVTPRRFSLLIAATAAALIATNSVGTVAVFSPAAAHLGASPKTVATAKRTSQTSSSVHKTAGHATTTHLTSTTAKGSASKTTSNSASLSQSKSSSQSGTGWLHTQGSSIVDGNGKIVVLRGMNISGLEYSPAPPGDTRPGPSWLNNTPTSNLFVNTAQWGFNVVRLPISLDNLEPNGPTYNAAYVAQLKATVGWARANNLRVILDIHQIGLSPYFTIDQGIHQGTRGAGFPSWWFSGYTNNSPGRVRAYKDFFNNVGGHETEAANDVHYIASLFASDPTVIGFDLFNEPFALTPLTTTLSTLTNYYSMVGTAARSANPHLLLFIEDLNQATPMVTTLPAISGAPAATCHCLVYSFHDYMANWATVGIAKTTSHVTQATALGLPIWIGEFARANIANPPSCDSFSADLQQALAYFSAQNISWTYWAYAMSWCPIGRDNDNAKKPYPPVDPSLLTLLQAGALNRRS